MFLHFPHILYEIKWTFFHWLIPVDCWNEIPKFHLHLRTIHIMKCQLFKILFTQHGDGLCASSRKKSKAAVCERAPLCTWLRGCMHMRWKVGARRLSSTLPWGQEESHSAGALGRLPAPPLPPACRIWEKLKHFRRRRDSRHPQWAQRAMGISWYTLFNNCDKKRVRGLFNIAVRALVI